jgi:hypothetical protein
MDTFSAARGQMELSLGVHMVLVASGIAVPLLMLLASVAVAAYRPAPLPRPGPQVGQGHRTAKESTLSDGPDRLTPNEKRARNLFGAINSITDS